SGALPESRYLALGSRMLSLRHTTDVVMNHWDLIHRWWGNVSFAQASKNVACCRRTDVIDPYWQTHVACRLRKESSRPMNAGVVQTCDWQNFVDHVRALSETQA